MPNRGREGKRAPCSSQGLAGGSARNVRCMHCATGLTHADQRITEDVEKFAFAISELYSYTFKPLLDVVLFTRALARSMG